VSPFHRRLFFIIIINTIMSQLVLNLVLAIGLPWISAQIVPFVNCTINDGSICWGYTNSYPNTLVLPLFRNRHTPAPLFRGQPTVFQGNTTVFRAFNIPVDRVKLVIKSGV
jgi:hypothetical protein